MHVDTLLKRGIAGFKVNAVCFSVLLDEQPIMLIFNQTAGISLIYFCIASGESNTPNFQ